MNYDFSAFTGHWPFRRLGRSSLPELLADYKKHGISGGILSSLDAVFYNDPWEADGPLLDALAGSPWELAMCVNPRLPWAEAAIRNAHSLGVRHLRLYPGIHHYPLQEAADICPLAAELNMTVIITGRMEDERLCYLLEQQPVSPGACVALARRFPDTRFLLTYFYLSELLCCGSVPKNLWTDTSGLCHGLHPIQNLMEGGFPSDQIVFGSLTPLQCLESHLLNLPDTHKSNILSANPTRFLEVHHDRL